MNGHEQDPGIEAEMRHESVRNLVGTALVYIRHRYGSGIGDGENPKAYHNIWHTYDVVKAAKKIAQKACVEGKISPDDIDLVELAAAYHDFVHELESGENEFASAQAAKSSMEAVGVFTPNDVQKVWDMIMATVVYFDEDGGMHQSATDAYLTGIVADADLSSLGSPDSFYWERVKSLFKERFPDEQFSKTHPFVLNQTRILAGHKFYTPEANELFPHKAANIEFVTNLLA